VLELHEDAVARIGLHINLLKTYHQV